MPVTPGPQFPPQEAPTLTEIVDTSDSDDYLIPERMTTLYASFGPKVAGEPERGATITLKGPTMYKYKSAQSWDPGALFSYDRPVLENAYASEGDQHLIPSMLALAHKSTGVGKGRIEASDSLSTWSQKLAEKFADKGLASIPDDVENNSLSFSNSGGQLADIRRMIGNTPHRDPAQDYEEDFNNYDTVDTREIKADVPLKSALAEGREHLRKVLRGSKNVPVVPRHAKPISNMPGQEKLF
jgi:hypothetical protein